jgi:hypothetical protein
MCGAAVLTESPAPKVEGSIKPAKVDALMVDEHDELPRQDIVAAAVRMASSLIVSEHLVRHKRTEFPEYAVAQEYAARAAPWKQGWARKPRRGDTYGANYVGEFKKDIEQWFGAGNVDENSKVSPAQVCERIRLEHPNRYCEPWMVQNFYNALGQRNGGSDAEGGARGPKSRLPPEVVQLRWSACFAGGCGHGRQAGCRESNCAPAIPETERRVACDSGRQGVLPQKCPEEGSRRSR